MKADSFFQVSHVYILLCHLVSHSRYEDGGLFLYWKSRGYYGIEWLFVMPFLTILGS